MRITRVAVGALLVGLGVVGLVVPVMPGWLFILPGLSLWAGEFGWAERLMRRARGHLRAFGDPERDRSRPTDRAA